MHESSGYGDLSAVPLFPLPNVVLFPRAVLPLHIFEERYKQMTADALAGDRLIAMALLRPGWEKNYYAKPAIEPVVCVGKILPHERLPDGKYNFLLQGQLRAKIIQEHGDLPYRVAQLEPLVGSAVMEIDLAEQRRRLSEFFADEAFAGLRALEQFRQLLDSSLSTSDVADVLAFNLIEDVGLKQSLLAEKNVRGRVSRIVGAVEELRPVLVAMARRRLKTPSLN